MTKNVSHISTRIKCPDCATKTMRPSVANWGKPYFCDKCHKYFSVEFLVHEHNYDCGDFVSDNFDMPTNEIWNSIKLAVSTKPVDKIVDTTWFDGDTVSVIDEPVFHSLTERDEAYQMVQRMFDDIPEWENNKVDYGYPI